MRLLLATIVLAAPLAAQQAAPPEKKEPPVAKESPTPAAEKPWQLSVDAAYRWVGDVRGDFNSYRSVVNLGDGPKLLGLDFSASNASRKVFDTLRVSAHNWGGDPYNTVYAEMERKGAYRFRGDYRNIAYFNFLPSFANPQIGQGALLNQRSYDMTRRHAFGGLELMPGKKIVPFFEYSGTFGTGNGITPFVANGNEYPVGTTLDDGTSNYRGGVRLEYGRWHVTLAQGGTTFFDNQRVFNDGRARGNRTTPLLGQNLYLDKLNQAYGIDGKSMYSEGLLAASPASWLNVHGQFVFSQPKMDIRYTDSAQGLFYLGATRFFNGQESLLSALAKQPHTSGLVGFELKPHARIRVVESLMTDRLHNASSALLTERLLFASGPAETAELFSADRLALNYNRQQVDVLVDVCRWMTLRGGHRYLWGDAATRPASLRATAQPQPAAGEMRQQIGIGGLNFRTKERFRLNAEYEGSPGDRYYFRTSLHNYHRVRVRSRLQAHSSLLFHVDYSLLDNQNPARGVAYDFNSQAISGSVQWMPFGGKHISLLGDYTRSRLRSDINFLVPQVLQYARSYYRDDAHGATSLLDVTFPKFSGVGARAMVGGALFASTGSRPSRYYQPVGRILVSLHRAVEWYAEWRWYGLTETYYLYEGFRSNQLVTGLRLTP